MLAAVAAGAAILIGGARGGSPAGTYGQIPAWLPKPTTKVGRVVTASGAHTWLAIQGDVVRVELAAGRVRALAVGPSVPEDGQFPVPPTSPCTFTVTLSKASGRVPLAASAFTILDERGGLHRPQVRLYGGGPLPAAVRPGTTIRLTVHDVLPTGEGRLRWAPNGGRPIVSWDFDVEID